jgi:hypothetical protein
VIGPERRRTCKGPSVAVAACHASGPTTGKASVPVGRRRSGVMGPCPPRMHHGVDTPHRARLMPMLMLMRGNGLNWHHVVHRMMTPGGTDGGLRMVTAPLEAVPLCSFPCLIKLCGCGVVRTSEETKYLRASRSSPRAEGHPKGSTDPRWDGVVAWRVSDGRTVRWAPGLCRGYGVHCRAAGVTGHHHRHRRTRSVAIDLRQEFGSGRTSSQPVRLSE